MGSFLSLLKFQQRLKICVAASYRELIYTSVLWPAEGLGFLHTTFCWKQQWPRSLVADDKDQEAEQKGAVLRALEPAAASVCVEVLLPAWRTAPAGYCACSLTGNPSLSPGEWGVPSEKAEDCAAVICGGCVPRKADFGKSALHCTPHLLQVCCSCSNRQQKYL